jgi:hypothetical protein
VAKSEYGKIETLIYRVDLPHIGVRIGCNGFVATYFLCGKHGNIEGWKYGNMERKGCVSDV